MNSGLRIGITFRDDAPLSQLWWGNGIGQNIKFYYDLFEAMGHEVWMIRDNSDHSISHNDKTYNSVDKTTIVAKREKFDLIVEAGTTISLADKALLRESTDAHIVGLRCGNQYFIASEGLFVNKQLPTDLYLQGQDRIWLLPHYAEQASFLTTLHRCPVDVVPYIWEPDFVDTSLTSLPLEETPDIYVMEPNISVTKNALVPMAILEHLFVAHPESFNKAYVLNSDEFASKDYFLNNFVTNFSVLRAGNERAYFCGRYPMNAVFKKRDILLGFQFENGLNNLYKEALYMGIPLVHNSPFYEEVGHYYHKMEIHRAVEQLLKAREQGASATEMTKNRQFLQDYSIRNEGLQQRYDELLDTVLRPDRLVVDMVPKPALAYQYEVSDGTASSHFLAKGYRSRRSVIHWDDTESTDEYQDEVYRFARRLAVERGYQRIVDFGCGSAYKLLKYFKGFDNTGYEIEPALDFLRARYPFGDWREGRFEPDCFDDADLVICSDVIEHIEQPDKLLDAIRLSSAKSIILSTPSLEIFADWGGTASTRYGPPAIPTHFREWTTLEFGRFVNQFLPVTEHHVLDVYQSTQLVFSDRDRQSIVEIERGQIPLPLNDLSQDKATIQ